MTKIRVLVVDDSITVRKRLVEILSADSDFEVVGEAGDGKRAIELCVELRPDVITLDMMLPVMTGLAATEYIMAHCPTPILIVSASVNRGELFRTYDALAAGAVDVLDKPTGGESNDAWESRFVSAVKLVSRIRVITHPRARLSGMTAPREPARAALGRPLRTPLRIVAIGASTGGPGAIVQVLSTIPERLVPIVIVLHIGEPFGTALADWLDNQTAHRVVFAREDERVDDLFGRVTLAPPGVHLSISAGRLRLTTAAERHSCRPSVDVLFESVANDYGPAAIGCLLTGMGRDGAAGLLAVRRAGALTVAQDEVTSVVYGMPREAVQLGAAERVLPLGAIGPFVSESLGFGKAAVP